MSGAFCRREMPDEVWSRLRKGVKMGNCDNVVRNNDEHLEDGPLAKDLSTKRDPLGWQTSFTNMIPRSRAAL